MAKGILRLSPNYNLYGRPIKPKRKSVKKSAKNEIFDKQKGKCFFCKKRLNLASTHYDHIKEVSKGGSNRLTNLRAVCANCHYERHNRDKANKIIRKRTINPLAIPKIKGFNF